MSASMNVCFDECPLRRMSAPPNIRLPFLPSDRQAGRANKCALFNCKYF
jgi:hypothetical protein